MPRVLPQIWNENGVKGEAGRGFITAAWSRQAAGKFGWCVHASAATLSSSCHKQVVCRAPANHYCVDTRDPVCGHACKYRNLERLSLVEKYYGKREEASEDAGKSC